MGETKAMNIASDDEAEALRSVLFGRSVVAVKMVENGPEMERWGPHVQGEVHLDDGTVLLLAGHVGGCSCSAGDYDLTRLNDMPINGITNVTVEVDTSRIDERWGEGPQTYSIFVMAQDERFELAAFDGSDGNGYYGTGFWFSVVAPGSSRTRASGKSTEQRRG